MTTRHRNLRTGRPFWLSRRMPAVPRQELSRDLKTDVLVIGAGITGALVAEALSEEHRVTIVDRRGAVKGSTAASTTLITYEIDTPLSVLAKDIGEDAAARAWRRSMLAVRALRARIRELGIDCSLEDCASVYLAGNELGPGGLRDEAEARRAAGIESLYLPRSALTERFGVDRAGAVFSRDHIAADPRRLASGLLNAAIARGARLYAPAEITAVEVGRNGILAQSAGGPAIACRTLVYATGYEMPDFIPAGRHRVVSTYAITTRPQPGKVPACCFFWEASEPYLYLRAAPDGSVICGGEDEDFGDAERRDALLPAKAERLRKKIERLFPKLDATPEFAWAGSFGTTRTGLPSIGEVPGKKNVFAVLGFGGNGFSYAKIGADHIRTVLSGRQDPDADLYAFRR